MIVKPQAPTSNVATSNNNGVTFTDQPVSSAAVAPTSVTPVQNQQVQASQAPASVSAASAARVVRNSSVSVARTINTQNVNNNRVLNQQSAANNNCNIQQSNSQAVDASQSVSNNSSQSANYYHNSKLNNTTLDNTQKSDSSANVNPKNDLNNVKKNDTDTPLNSTPDVQAKNDSNVKPTFNNFAAVPNMNFATNTVASRSLGVDVSGYQGTDLSSYARDGAKFAVVKLSEGTSYYNPNAAGQIKSAEQNNMLAMGYHFARFGSSTSQADAEARHAIANAQLYGLPKGAYLACDYEDGSGAGSNVQANTAAVLEFMKDVKNAGYIPLLYSGRYYMQSKLNLSEIGNAYGTCLWVAQYPTTAPVSGPNFNYFPSMNNVLMWQYSDNWHGVDGDVTVQPLVNGQSTGGSGNVPSSNTSSSKPSSSNTSNEPTWTDNLGKVWHKETGIFTVGNTPIHLRWGATPTSTIITTLQPGQQIQYDAWMNDGTYTWIRQPRGNGTYGYLAVRDKSGPFGTFKDLPNQNTNNNKPAQSNNNKPANNSKPAQSNNNKPANNSKPAQSSNNKPTNNKPAQSSNNKPANNPKPTQSNNSKPANNSSSNQPAATQNNYTGQKYANGHWQYWNNGTPVKNTYEWIPSENKETYYDQNGNMVYGWQNINGQKRYFDPTTGAQAKSCTLTIDGQKWNFDGQGTPSLVSSSTPVSSSTSSASPSNTVSVGTTSSETPAGNPSSSSATPSTSTTTNYPGSTVGVSVAGSNSSASSSKDTFSPSTPISINGNPVNNNPAVNPSSNANGSSVVQKNSQALSSHSESQSHVGLSHAGSQVASHKTTQNSVASHSTDHKLANKQAAGKLTNQGSKKPAKQTASNVQKKANNKHLDHSSVAKDSVAVQSGKGNQWQSQGQHVNVKKNPAKIVKASNPVAQLAAKRNGCTPAGSSCQNTCKAPKTCGNAVTAGTTPVSKATETTTPVATSTVGSKAQPQQASVQTQEPSAQGTQATASAVTPNVNSSSSASSNAMPATGMHNQLADELGVVGVGLVLGVAAKRAKKGKNK